FRGGLGILPARSHGAARLPRGNRRWRKGLHGRIAHGVIGIAFSVALQFDESNVYGSRSTIVLRFPKHRVIGKQWISSGLLEPAPCLGEMRARVVVISQSQCGPGADRGTLFPFRKLRQPLVRRTYGVLV